MPLQTFPSYVREPLPEWAISLLWPEKFVISFLPWLIGRSVFIFSGGASEWVAWRGRGIESPAKILNGSSLQFPSRVSKRCRSGLGTYSVREAGCSFIDLSSYSLSETLSKNSACRGGLSLRFFTGIFEVKLSRSWEVAVLDGNTSHWWSQSSTCSRSYNNTSACKSFLGRKGLQSTPSRG